MALSVDYLYKFSLRLIKKNQAGGLTSLEFADFWNDSQSAFMSDLLGRFQLRSNGKTGANTGLILDETILQKLSPFTKPAALTIATGTSDKPTGLAYRLAMRINGVDCFKINHNQIATVNASVIDPPSITEDSYYFIEYEDYYSFLPTTVTAAALDYIEVPANVVWAYTFDADGRQVYNASGITGLDVVFGGVGYTAPTIAFSAPAVGGVQATATLTVASGVITEVVMTNIGEGYAGLTPTFTITGASTTPANFGNPIVSVDPKWDNISAMEITKRMLKVIGVSFKDNDFANFGNQVMQSGE